MEQNNVKESVKVEGENDKGITLNDLILLKQIVNVASRRGAFSAEEFKDIGEVYNRLDSFINIQMKLLEDNKEKTDTVEDVNDVDKKEVSIFTTHF